MPVLPNVLRALLPEGAVRMPEARYLEEPRGRWTGQGGVLVLPRSHGEVQAVVRACAEARVGIVPWGGGTGLVGGQVLARWAAAGDPVAGADGGGAGHLAG